MTPVERFMAKVDKQPDGCWRWTGTIHAWGYGQFNSGTRTPAGNWRPEQAHRFAYRTFVGSIPVGFVVDHLCENRACVNPAHLEPVTNAENIARHYRRRNPTHCRNGHPWNEANTVWYTPAARRCRRCHAEQQNARYHRARSEEAA